MDIKNLDRMRVGRAPKDAQEVGVILRPSSKSACVAKLRSPTVQMVAPSSGDSMATTNDGDMTALQEEVKRLRTALDKAVKINEKMWNGVVDLKLAA